MYTGEDRRMFDRIDGELKVKYCSVRARKEVYTGTINIGGGGMRMYLPKKLTPCTVIDIEIFGSNENMRVKGKAEIVWLSKPRDKKRKGHAFEAGVKFLDLDFIYIGSLIKDLTPYEQINPSLTEKR